MNRRTREREVLKEKWNRRTSRILAVLHNFIQPILIKIGNHFKISYKILQYFVSRRSTKTHISQLPARRRHKTLITLPYSTSIVLWCGVGKIQIEPKVDRNFKWWWHRSLSLASCRGGNGKPDASNSAFACQCQSLMAMLLKSESLAGLTNLHVFNLNYQIRLGPYEQYSHFGSLSGVLMWVHRYLTVITYTQFEVARIRASNYSFDFKFGLVVLTCYLRTARANWQKQ